MAEVMEQIRLRAENESPLLAAALRSGEAPSPRYAGRCPDRYLVGVEMIREGYLLHHGRSVLFGQEDPDLALLTGDYLYAAPKWCELTTETMATSRVLRHFSMARRMPNSAAG